MNGQDFAIGLGTGIILGFVIGALAPCPKQHSPKWRLRFKAMPDPVVQSESLNKGTRYEVTQVEAGDEQIDGNELDDLVLTVGDGSGNIGTVIDDDPGDAAAVFETSQEVGATGQLVATATYNGEQVEARADVTIVDEGGVEPTDFVLKFRKLESGGGG
jgi:hypothetical protein